MDIMELFPSLTIKFMKSNVLKGVQHEEGSYIKKQEVIIYHYLHDVM